MKAKFQIGKKNTAFGRILGAKIFQDPLALIPFKFTFQPIALNNFFDYFLDDKKELRWFTRG